MLSNIADYLFVVFGVGYDEEDAYSIVLRWKPMIRTLLDCGRNDLSIAEEIATLEGVTW